MEGAERLVLGTAQLGGIYGINNQVGEVSLDGATKIVQTAFDSGIREFDTAQVYGKSETVLGKVFKVLGLEDVVQVISKISDKSLRESCDVVGLVQSSLTRLGVTRLSGLMLHHEKSLELWDEGLSEELNQVLELGFARRVGVSLYSPERALEALRKEEVSFIQIPTNILDCRFEAAGVFQLADNLGKDVYIRSVFLQGLLLMAPDAIPAHLASARQIISKLRALAERWSIDVQSLSLGYVFNRWPQARIAIGVESESQLKHNIEMIAKELSSEIVLDLEGSFLNVDETIINPALWAQNKT